MDFRSCGRGGGFLFPKSARPKKVYKFPNITSAIHFLAMAELARDDGLIVASVFGVSRSNLEICNGAFEAVESGGDFEGGLGVSSNFKTELLDGLSSAKAVAFCLRVLTLIRGTDLLRSLSGLLPSANIRLNCLEDPKCLQDSSLRCLHCLHSSPEF
uniref:Uncharacterized protein n=1 Tax=Glossina austeni TaxID=7395 RepID=A0A1A9UK33_GLOAU